jgi:hypothetical protein
MIPSNKLHPIRIPQFQAREERDSLHREQSPIDVVSEEEVVRMRRVTAYPKDLDQVVELPIHAHPYQSSAQYEGRRDGTDP